MNRIANTYYDYAIKLMKLMYLNLLWIVFTLLGLGIFGLLPATTAVFAVTRKWNTGIKDFPIFNTFWEIYKKEFVQSNLYGLVFIGVSYLLLVSYRILRTQITLPYLIASYIVIGLLLLLLIGITYFFPIYVHFDLKKSDYLKWPLIIGINHPILTLILVGGVGLMQYLALEYSPGILLFLGTSLTAYIVSWGVSKVYPLYTAKYYKNNNA